jgi:sulfur carrier protein
MMKVNGEERPLADLKSPDVRSLLELYGINPAGVAIEINGRVIPRQKWNEVKLNNEDRIELIRFVGGG